MGLRISPVLRGLIDHDTHSYLRDTLTSGGSPGQAGLETQTPPQRPRVREQQPVMEANRGYLATPLMDVDNMPPRPQDVPTDLPPASLPGGRDPLVEQGVPGPGSFAEGQNPSVWGRMKENVQRGLARSDEAMTGFQEQTGDQINPESNPAMNPLRMIFGDAAIDAIPGGRPKSTPGYGPEDEIETPRSPTDPLDPTAPTAPADPTDSTPRILQIARESGTPAGQSFAEVMNPSVDPYSPEAFNEDGLRDPDVRKAGLMVRLFGEEGSDERKGMSRALMMAGAVMMTTDGNLGQALGEAVKAGITTYDESIQAIRDEERTMRQMGMAEEAHELNMQLKQLQLRMGEMRLKAGVGGGSGSGKAEKNPLVETMRTMEMTMAAAPELASRLTQLFGRQVSNEEAFDRSYRGIANHAPVRPRTEAGLGFDLD